MRRINTSFQLLPPSTVMVQEAGGGVLRFFDSYVIKMAVYNQCCFGGAVQIVWYLPGSNFGPERSQERPPNFLRGHGGDAQ